MVTACERRVIVWGSDENRDKRVCLDIRVQVFTSGTLAGHEEPGFDRYRDPYV